MNKGKGKTKKVKRREFVRNIFFSFTSLLIPGIVSADETIKKVKKWILGEDYNPYEHYWGMGIDINKCIGCGQCAYQCKQNNIEMYPNERVVYLPILKKSEARVTA